MTKDEALKLALEALEAHADIGINSDKAITAIKEALAQPEIEYQERILRLEGALKKANDQAEHFEREWYLRGDQIERFKAQPEQKPVAGWTGNTNADAALVMLDRLDVSPDDDDRVDEISNIVRRLATPPQRTWVGLTKTEVVDLLCEYSKLTGNVGWQQLIYMTEAKLKQKNGYAEEKNT